MPKTKTQILDFNPNSLRAKRFLWVSFVVLLLLTAGLLWRFRSILFYLGKNTQTATPVHFLKSKNK